MMTTDNKSLPPWRREAYQALLEIMRRESLTPAQVAPRFGLTERRVKMALQYEREETKPAYQGAGAEEEGNG